MISDTLFEAVCEIEKYEKDLLQCYADHAEEIRKVKLEMMILQGRFDMVPPVAETITPADLDWIRAEALKRGATKAALRVRRRVSGSVCASSGRSGRSGATVLNSTLTIRRNWKGPSNEDVHLLPRQGMRRFSICPAFSPFLGN